MSEVRYRDSQNFVQKIDHSSLDLVFTRFYKSMCTIGDIIVIRCVRNYKEICDSFPVSSTK